jgi:hypothetical protein
MAAESITKSAVDDVPHTPSRTKPVPLVPDSLAQLAVPVEPAVPVTEADITAVPEVPFSQEIPDIWQRVPCVPAVAPPVPGIVPPKIVNIALDPAVPAPTVPVVPAVPERNMVTTSTIVFLNASFNLMAILLPPVF